MHNPSVFSIEEIFYSNNIKSSLLLGHARGTAIAAASIQDIIIYEYSARKVKQSITGNGNAHKEQVQFMVKARLGMDVMPEPIDASDALAVALCHQSQFKNMDL